MRKILYCSLGALLAIPGLLIAISPLPLGFLLLLPGMMFLIMGSERVRRWVSERRRRNREINARMADVEDTLPPSVSAPLKTTRP